MEIDLRHIMNIDSPSMMTSRLLDLDQDDDLEDDLLEPFGLSPDEPYPPSQFPVSGFPGPGSFPGSLPQSSPGQIPGAMAQLFSSPRSSPGQIPEAMAQLFSREDLALALEEPEEILKATEPFRLLPEKLKLNHPELITPDEDEMK